ncbi:hypothetical protein IMCC3317_17710 [Kordia antarctica]|uniref:Secreted protein n=1 Tax=Kordia antarctica TaxID=1218801 RepID=A0A7L4ZI47_9FLAO|nr:hypothetical protein [Kordia antarctica]QHI36408.1 hypothetical protein IMCC3317_17710 [Kordia antarctica]
MKTNFRLLIVSLIFSITLNSCTIDDDINQEETNQTQTQSNGNISDPPDQELEPEPCVDPELEPCED